jgi:rhodanese-related sulfurtransferase
VAAFVSASAANAWLGDLAHSYLLDVRTPEEFAASAVPASHAPGGH